jgi:hypothetical protein
MATEPKRPKGFWSNHIKKHILSDCKCGATQDGGDVYMIYAGCGDYSAWNVYCRSCKRRATAKTEQEAVDKWNRGEQG